ncbi:MAG: hypothetical protein ACRD2O_01070 [Terriglobia bacterium]
MTTKTLRLLISLDLENLGATELTGNVRAEQRFAIQIGLKGEARLSAG